MYIKTKKNITKIYNNKYKLKQNIGYKFIKLHANFQIKIYIFI